LDGYHINFIQSTARKTREYSVNTALQSAISNFLSEHVNII